MRPWKRNAAGTATTAFFFSSVLSPALTRRRHYTMASPEPGAARLFKVPILSSFEFCLGLKGGTSWYLITSRPRGVRRGPMAREQLCLNILAPGLPPPRSSHRAPSTPATLVMAPGPESKEIVDILVKGKIVECTGRTFDCGVMARDQPELKVLLNQGEYLEACEGCGNWEWVGRERYSRCGGCKARFYCSKSVCDFELTEVWSMTASF